MNVKWSLSRNFRPVLGYIEKSRLTFCVTVGCFPGVVYCESNLHML